MRVRLIAALRALEKIGIHAERDIEGLYTIACIRLGL